MRPLLSMLLLVWLVLPRPAAGQPFSSAESVPHLRVHGEAQLQVPADQLRLSVGVTTQAADADTALARNSTRMRAVEQALRETGLDKKEYRTGHFSVQPQWTPRPRQAPPDWQPTISGFTVSNSFAVVTPKLKLAGPLIEAAVKAGANTVGDLFFDLADPQAARAEAIRQATTVARTRARTLAAAAGVPLGTVLAIALDQAAIRPQQLQAVRLETMAAGGEPPMAPGEVTVHAGVTMTYRLMPTAGP
jgi:uncharacterized protein YggE